MFPQRKPQLAAFVLSVASLFVTSRCFDVTSVDGSVAAAQACRAGDNPGLAVAVVREGRTLLANGYGVTRIHGNERATATTRFHIASLTKAFTATLLLKVMEEDGRLVLGFYSPFFL